MGCPGNYERPFIGIVDEWAKRYQPTLKTISIKLYLKSVRSDKAKLTVYTRLLYNRSKAEFTTGLRCTKADWNNTKEQFKNSSLLNQKLAEITEKIYRAKNELDDQSREYSARDLKALFNGEKRSSMLLTDFYEDYLRNKTKEGRTTESTTQKYAQTLSYLKAFLNEAKLRAKRINDVQLRFITAFDEYLKNVVWNEFGDRLSKTTINKHHSRFKAVLNDSINKGFLTFNPYRNFKLSFPNSKREYLTTKELNSIQELDLTENESLDKTRDIFLFSCYTGLRYKDAINLKMSGISKINEQVYLRIDQGKTGERREIPIIDRALQVIEKYSFSNDRLVKNLVLPTMSNQKTNQYLKYIANLAGIRKPLSHHIARHTCATTILLDNNVPLETVSHWLGHNSVRTTQIYAKTSHEKLSKESKRINSILK